MVNIMMLIINSILENDTYYRYSNGYYVNNY